MTTIGNLPNSLKDKILKGGREVLDVAITGLDLISRFTSTRIDDTAGAVLASVRGVLSLIEGAADGTVKPEDCKAAFEGLEAKIAANNAAIDAQVASFPSGTETPK